VALNTITLTSQQVRVHRLKISIQEDVLFLLAMSQQVRVHRLKISIQEDVLFLLAMSQQVRVHWLKISIQGDVLFLLTHLFVFLPRACNHSPGFFDHFFLPFNYISTFSNGAIKNNLECKPTLVSEEKIFA
jgi:hypothetical protein